MADFDVGSLIRSPQLFLRQICKKMQIKIISGRQRMRFAVRYYLEFLRIFLITPKLTSPAGARVILSVASHGSRVHGLGACLSWLRHQSVKPQRIIAVLPENEWGQRRLPAPLRRLQSAGLEIVFQDDNHKSYKKFTAAFEQFPDWPVLVVDDDAWYASWTIEVLWSAHLLNPRALIGIRCRTPLLDGELVEYMKMPWASQGVYSDNVPLITTVGGALFPSGSNFKEMCGQHPAFDSLAESAFPTNDDIYLWHFARMHKLCVSVAAPPFPVSYDAIRNQLRHGNLFDKNITLNDDMVRQSIEIEASGSQA